MLAAQGDQRIVLAASDYVLDEAGLSPDLLLVGRCQALVRVQVTAPLPFLRGRASLQHVTIEAGEGDYSLRVQGGDVTLLDALLEPAVRAAAIVDGAGSSLTIMRTRVTASRYGLEADNGGSLTCHECRVEGAALSNVHLTGAGTTAELTDAHLAWSNGDAIDLRDGATLGLANVRIEGSSGHAIHAEGQATRVLTRPTGGALLLDDNGGGLSVVDAATVDADDVSIIAGRGGALVVDGGSAIIRRMVVRRDGGADVSAIRVSDGSASLTHLSVGDAEGPAVDVSGGIVPIEGARMGVVVVSGGALDLDGAGFESLSLADGAASLDDVHARTIALRDGALDLVDAALDDGLVANGDLWTLRATRLAAGTLDRSGGGELAATGLYTRGMTLLRAPGGLSTDGWTARRAIAVDIGEGTLEATRVAIVGAAGYGLRVTSGAVALEHV